MVQVRQAVLVLLLGGGIWLAAGTPTPKFFPDDPIQAMPRPMPVGNISRQAINDTLDFFGQSKENQQRRPTPAGAVNTLGDVPDSEWFTNRHALRRMSRDELQRGPRLSELPVPPFTVTGGKNEGISPGLRMKDAKGRHYFVKFDPLDYPELASAADVIVSRFLYAIGYNTPANEIVNLEMSDLLLSKTARISVGGERSREMTWKDVEAIIKGIPHYPDGSFRFMASLAVEGDSIGPFRYEGTRYDDPNDITPHENRRDLRGLGVFFAWLNNTDAKASNTFDTIVESNGVRFIRHYLIDFGSALGSDADRPKDPRLGNAFMWPSTTEALTRILTAGTIPAPWERTRFLKIRGIGNFESQSFDPNSWKTDYPNPAFLSRLPDDGFWAAKQVMAFSDDDIRAIVETACFRDQISADYMVATLSERRDKIGRTFFSKLLPLDHFRVVNRELIFDDLALQYGFHAQRRYRLQWAAFNNDTRESSPFPGADSTRLPPQIAGASAGSYFSAVIDSPGDPLKPVIVYLRKESNSYRIVGIDRMW
jgi:hypothetical protein